MTYYSHNDPHYISSLTRRLHRLRAAIRDTNDPLMERRLVYRMEDVLKQTAELEKYAHNNGYKRGA